VNPNPDNPTPNKVQYLARRLFSLGVDLVRVVNQEYAARLLMRAQVLATHSDFKVVIPASVH